MTHRPDAAPPGTAGTWNSALPHEEFAAVKGAGFEPVGQVLGTAVFNIGYTGPWSCPDSSPYATDLNALSSSKWAAPAPQLLQAAWTPSLSGLQRTLYTARRQALSRAVAECVALGGDGIVGVGLHTGRFPAGGVEFTVRATAVRARSRVRPGRPFTSHLNGQDFARLIHSGWVPTGLAFGISLAIGHDDWRGTRLLPRFTGNQEVDCYTRLINRVRRNARHHLAFNAAEHGGDGVVVDEVELKVDESECSSVEGSRDLTAEAVLIGTSIARFGRSERPAGLRPLTIMRLGDER
ncbi:heavy metal-binding domain-containing protein [Streptomyces sp. NPDC096339]|uniref:heavy metal-binding domain-containing protein n=1 Tax=Streptomyces sp. NPDC096339 TaxID=3366086 RepID=UPI00382652BC